jgi:phosphate transport system ATP-binding protein
VIDCGVAHPRIDSFAMARAPSTAAVSFVPPACAIESVMECDVETLHYGDFQAVRDTRVPFAKGTITAFIGPSGCGKSTVLRCLNRMNDHVHGFRLKGAVMFRGSNIYDHAVDPVTVRRFIGMVFQEPNPFTLSIFDNVAFGLRINGYAGDKAERVEQALRRAALWDEVKDKLKSSGLSLSGGQQQRLCIARAIATEPEVLLMDEPCASLDPIATHQIEKLMLELKERHTIVLVTHNLQQAARVADKTAFMYVDIEKQRGSGYLVEYGPTHDIFQCPREAATRAYIEGKFG